MLLSLNARLQLGHFSPNLVDFLLDREFIETRKGQAQADAAIEVRGHVRDLQLLGASGQMDAEA